MLRMIKINTIKIYSHIPDRYYTDGEDIYIVIQKEKNAKRYRTRYDNQTVWITDDNIETVRNLTGRSYHFENKKLYLKAKWQIDKDGYFFFMVLFNKKPFKISKHRLIYFYNNNTIPQSGYIIDHIDRNKQNNNINNLRLVTFAQNSSNVDKKELSKKISKYVYRCVNINDGTVIEGLAMDICNKIGISNTLINRYAKHNYIYKGIYKITIIGEIKNDRFS